MRGVALICSGLFLIATSAAAQPRLKRDDTPAPVAATAATATLAKKGRGARRGRTARQEAPKEAPPVVDTRPRLKRDDNPVPVTAATPAAPQPRWRHRLRTAAKPRGGAEQPAGAAAATPVKSTMRDIALCAQTKQADPAIEGCTRVIDDPKQKPKLRAGAYFNRGNALQQKGEADKAIADFDEAIKLEPKSPNAYNNRGTVKNEKGDADGAIEDFNAAIKHDARYASAFFNRANALAAKGESA
ncbi:MAG: tetratricopeptide repeat protein, partial [Alphaproteobacteria bacterium]|nr:tetratricopeptide repeat protein [Alphaproteobacteria bacterium]